MTVLSLNEATIDSTEFTRSLQRFIGLQAEIDALKEDIKELVQETSDKNKMEKSTVKKYLMARYKAQTKDVSATGELFAAIDNLLDN